MTHQPECPMFTFRMPTTLDLHFRQPTSSARPTGSIDYLPHLGSHPPPQRRTTRHRRSRANAKIQDRAYLHGEDREGYHPVPHESIHATLPKRRIIVDIAESGWGALIERRPYVRQKLIDEADVFMVQYFPTTIGYWPPHPDEIVSHDIDMADGPSQVAIPLHSTAHSTFSYGVHQPGVMTYQPTLRDHSPVSFTIDVQSPAHHDVPMLDMPDQSSSTSPQPLGHNDLRPENLSSAFLHDSSPSPGLHILAEMNTDQDFSSQASSASLPLESNTLPLQAIHASPVIFTEPVASKHALDQASDSLVGTSPMTDAAIFPIAPEQEDRVFKVDQAVAIGPSATGTGAETPKHLSDQALLDSLSRTAPSIPHASAGEFDRSPSVDEASLEPIGSEVIDFRPMSDIAVPRSALEQEAYRTLEINQGAVSPTSAVPDLTRLSDDDQAPDMCPPRPGAESEEEEDKCPTAAIDPSHDSGEVSSAVQDSTDPACIEQEIEERPNENQVENVLADDEDDLDDYEDTEAAATDERVDEDTSEPDGRENLPPAPLNILHELSSHKRQELRQEAHDFLLDIVADLDPSTTSDEEDDLLGISLDVLSV